MRVNPKYYYNLSGNITDGEKEYSLHHKEDKIGGLSVSSGLKENHIEYGTNSLLDLLNELDKLAEENNELKKENEQLKKDLIDHSALISMLEDYQALKIEDTLYNLTGAKSEEEFNELYKPYLVKAKRCWR